MGYFKKNWMLAGGTISVVLFYVLFFLSFLYAGLVCPEPSCGLAGLAYPLYFLLPWAWFVETSLLLFTLQTISVFLLGSLTGFLLRLSSPSKEEPFPVLMLLSVYLLAYPVLATAIMFFSFFSEMTPKTILIVLTSLVIEVTILIGVLVRNKWARRLLLVWYGLSLIIFLYQLYPYFLAMRQENIAIWSVHWAPRILMAIYIFSNRKYFLIPPVTGMQNTMPPNNT